MHESTTTYTAFLHGRRVFGGSLADVAIATKHLDADKPVLIFDDTTGHQLDVDTGGTDADIRARYTTTEPTRGRGRPRLGVVPREVTLLPRHWDWLNRQPGGASAALRRLVDGARNDSSAAQRDAERMAHEAAYAFMHAIAGDYPQFEEASRALFANDRDRLAEQIARWPHDVRAHVIALAFGSNAANG